jgi:hypothetical protein
VPKRIQRKRTKGWRLPPNTVCVTRPSIFGNPFKWQGAREAGYRGTDDQLREFAVQIFREWLTDNKRYGHGREELRQKVIARLPELRGKDLACFCAEGQACHADVLLELANREVPQ